MTVSITIGVKDPASTKLSPNTPARYPRDPHLSPAFPRPERIDRDLARKSRSAFGILARPNPQAHSLEDISRRPVHQVMGCAVGVIPPTAFHVLSVPFGLAHDPHPSAYAKPLSIGPDEPVSRKFPANTRRAPIEHE